MAAMLPPVSFKLRSIYRWWVRVYVTPIGGGGWGGIYGAVQIH